MEEKLLETTEEVIEVTAEEAVTKCSRSGLKTLGVAGVLLTVGVGIYYGVKKFKNRKTNKDVIEADFVEAEVVDND